MICFDLKERLFIYFKMLDELNDSEHFTEKINLDGKWSDATKIEMGEFLMYLSASDGEITYEESEFIDEYLGVELAPAYINEYIIKRDIYSVEFEEKIPLVLRGLIDIENRFFEEGINLEWPPSNMTISVYRKLGTAFIECEGDPDEQARENLEIFLTTMRKYVKENSKQDRTPIKTGYDKKSRKTDEEAEYESDDIAEDEETESVSAPKKGQGL